MVIAFAETPTTTTTTTTTTSTSLLDEAHAAAESSHYRSAHRLVRTTTNQRDASKRWPSRNIRVAEPSQSHNRRQSPTIHDPFFGRPTLTGGSFSPGLVLRPCSTVARQLFFSTSLRM